MKGNAYQRSVSSEEACEGYVFVLKDALGFFPTVGRTFEIQQGTVTRTVRLESRTCECRGPEKPHEHYFFKWEPIRQGDTVVVQRDEKKPGRYHLQIRSVRAQRELCG